MRLNIVKSKNAKQLYIIKSFRKGSKNISSIVKKLGTIASLLPARENDRTNFELHHIYRVLDVLAKESDKVRIYEATMQSSTTTAQTSSLRLKRRAGSGNTARAKSTAPTP